MGKRKQPGGRETDELSDGGFGFSDGSDDEATDGFGGVVFKDSKLQKVWQRSTAEELSDGGYEFSDGSDDSGDEEGAVVFKSEELQQSWQAGANSTEPGGKMKAKRAAQPAAPRAAEPAAAAAEPAAGVFEVPAWE